MDFQRISTWFSHRRSYRYHIGQKKLNHVSSGRSSQGQHSVALDTSTQLSLSHTWRPHVHPFSFHHFTLQIPNHEKLDFKMLSTCQGIVMWKSFGSSFPRIIFIWFLLAMPWTIQFIQYVAWSSYSGFYIQMASWCFVISGHGPVGSLVFKWPRCEMMFLLNLFDWIHFMAVICHFKCWCLTSFEHMCRNVHPEKWTSLSDGQHQWGFDVDGDLKRCLPFHLVNWYHSRLFISHRPSVACGNFRGGQSFLIWNHLHRWILANVSGWRVLVRLRSSSWAKGMLKPRTSHVCSQGM